MLHKTVTKILRNKRKTWSVGYHSTIVEYLVKQKEVDNGGGYFLGSFAHVRNTHQNKPWNILMFIPNFEDEVSMEF